MNRKIYGITVGSPLPKSNLKQEDPSKGDYVKGKEIIPTKVSQLVNDNNYVDVTEIHNTVTEILEIEKENGDFVGKDGEDGYTPVKGVDYFTEEDKVEMVNRVLAAMDNWDEVSF